MLLLNSHTNFVCVEFTPFPSLPFPSCLVKEDPYLGIEGCECAGIESEFFGELYKGSRGCTAQSDNPGQGWTFGRRCHVEDPGRCEANIAARNQELAEEDPIRGLYKSTILVNGLRADFRRGCCPSTTPFYTEAEMCPKSDDVPNVLMCVGFFVGNSITLVCPLVFITTGIYFIRTCVRRVSSSLRVSSV